MLRRYVALTRELNYRKKRIALILPVIEERLSCNAILIQLVSEIHFIPQFPAHEGGRITPPSNDVAESSLKQTIGTCAVPQVLRCCQKAARDCRVERIGRPVGIHGGGKLTLWKIEGKSQVNNLTYVGKRTW